MPTLDRRGGRQLLGRTEFCLTNWFARIFGYVILIESEGNTMSKTAKKILKNITTGRYNQEQAYSAIDVAFQANRITAYESRVLEAAAQ